jgi:hypothetical protein
MATDQTGANNATTGTPAATRSATSSSASKTPSSSTSSTRQRTPNASADNVTPEGRDEHTLQDPIYGQPAAPTMSRADRAERDEVLRRRTTPETFEAVQQNRQAEESAALKASQERSK